MAYDSYLESAHPHLHTRADSQNTNSAKPGHREPAEGFWSGTEGYYVSDVFVAEAKWVNQDVIPSVCEGVEGEEGPVLMRSLDEFFSASRRRESCQRLFLHIEHVAPQLSLLRFGTNIVVLSHRRARHIEPLGKQIRVMSII